MVSRKPIYMNPKIKGDGKIRYDDDIVVVKHRKGAILYKGIKDDNPYKHELWKLDNMEGVYTCGDLVSYRIA